MNNFIEWSELQDHATFVTIVYMVVAFTKDLGIIKKINTRYWSFMVSFILIVLVNIQRSSFTLFDIVLYLLSAMSISLSSNGLADFNKKVGG